MVGLKFYKVKLDFKQLYIFINSNCVFKSSGTLD